MNWLCYILAALPALHLLTMLFCIIVVRRDKPRKKVASETPFVSILIAARNEEHNILRCLTSIALLDYEKYEVLIGDDMSEDRTAELVNSFIIDKPQFKLISITHTSGLAKGKANVLAQLAHQAKGEIFFVTDADIAVPISWVKSLLRFLNGKTAIVSGTTIVEGYGLFGTMQEIEWKYLMGFYNVVDRIMPITANGNNMCFKAEAYFMTGGYENIPFSVTEDYALWHAMKAKGYRHKQVADPESLCRSTPADSMQTMLKQRNRWLTGGKSEVWYSWLPLLAYLLFLPLITILSFCSLKIALIFLLTKLILDIIYIFKLSDILKVNSYPALLLIFEAYQMVFNVLGFGYFLTKAGKVEWKGREY